MIFAGIDIGSNTTKAALLENNQIIATHILSSGYQHADTADTILKALLNKAHRSESDIKTIISTGYGRKSVSFADKAMTEIICHAAGAHFINPHIRGIIDVGGQDSKAISLDENANVNNFAMNDKCAAGTGRFIEVMARTLNVLLDHMGQLSLCSAHPSKISAVCTVFAESEVISMIAKQEKREDIIAGIHEAAAARIIALATRIQIKEPIMMTGGVAKNIGMVAALEKRLNLQLIIDPLAQETGAIGAAVIASRQKFSRP
ncbi:MAG: acyl-CoA dehydratase activase [Pseudomonadota bacterium]